MSGLGRHSRGTKRELGSERHALCEFRLTQAARRFGSGRDNHHNYSRRGSLQAQGAEGDPIGYTMELILMSTAGTATLFLLQFMDFVCGEHATELASRFRAIPRLLADSDTLTAMVPVAAAYGR